jgi:hypothetical protein
MLHKWDCFTDSTKAKIPVLHANKQKIMYEATALLEIL